MRTPTITKKRNKLAFTPAQATFNKYRRKIDKLNTQKETLKNDLDSALKEYHSILLPYNRVVAELITNYLQKLIERTTDPKVITKNERQVLDKILKTDVKLIFDLIPHREISAEIKDLHQKIHGVSTDELFQNEMSSLEELLKETEGFEDLDLSNFSADDHISDILGKIAGAAFEASKNGAGDAPEPERKKTKKQLLKEQKAQELELLQNRTLGSIYKQLAKELHPDLEQNPEIRKEKEQVMKRLTAAYEDNDLTTLLLIQAERTSSDEKSIATVGDDTLKIYNSVLKDQIEAQQAELEMMIIHPRYLEIFSLIQHAPLKPLDAISQAYVEAQEIFEEYTCRMSDLSGPNWLKSLKKNLKSSSKEEDVLATIEALLYGLFE